VKGSAGLLEFADPVRGGPTDTFGELRRTRCSKSRERLLTGWQLPHSLSAEPRRFTITDRRYHHWRARAGIWYRKVCRRAGRASRINWRLIHRFHTFGIINAIC